MPSKYTTDEIKDKGLLILEYISGSQMYGTNTESSDLDIKGIFVLPDSDFSDYKFSPDWEEAESGKIVSSSGKECEIKYYELRKFMSLLEKNNPNILEIFNIPEDCLLYKHPLMDKILSKEKDIVTKKTYHSFSGYAYAQVSKAQGQNKKQNWETERFERKTILDFCYVPHEQGSIPVKQWFRNKGFWVMPKERYGLAKIPHMPGTFGIYEAQGLKGFTNFEETSTELRLSEVPKNLLPLTTMQFNENAWRVHCDEYKSYKTWLTERNEARWVDVKTHNQKIDGKNMLHMQRLINMAKDIALGKGIISRRPEAKDLLKIRKGEISLSDLMKSADQVLEDVKTIYANSLIPNDIEKGLCESIHNEIRAAFNEEKNNKQLNTLNISRAL